MLRAIIEINMNRENIQRIHAMVSAMIVLSALSGCSHKAPESVAPPPPQITVPPAVLLNNPKVSPDVKAALQGRPAVQGRPPTLSGQPN